MVAKKEKLFSPKFILWSAGWGGEAEVFDSEEVLKERIKELHTDGSIENDDSLQIFDLTNRRLCTITTTIVFDGKPL